jgi:hypothetical protein
MRMLTWRHAPSTRIAYLLAVLVPTGACQSVGGTISLLGEMQRCEASLRATEHEDQPLAEAQILSQACGSEAQTYALVVGSENPVIRGHVHHALLEHRIISEQSYSTCCHELTVSAITEDPERTGAFAGSRVTQRVSILPDTDIPVRRGIASYQFILPPLSLPPDGTPVRLTLRDRGRILASGLIALDPSIIVVPVHVAVFVQADATSRDLPLEANVRSWFDGPSLYLAAVPTPPGEPSPIVTTKTAGQFMNVDRVFAAAGIQFRVASIAILPQHDGLDSDLLNRTERERFRADGCRLQPPPSTEPRFYSHHRSRAELPGIHLHVGGYIAPGELLTHNLAVICDATGRLCSHGNIILLDGGRGPRLPYTVAHELGHALGLSHVQARGPCGAALFSTAADLVGNLMDAVPEEGNLNSGQHERVRTVACQHLSTWGLRGRACD